MVRLTALTALLLLALAAPAAAQEQRIAAGTKAGHLDVGGLTVNEAIVKLQQSYNASLGRPLSVHVAGHRYGLTMTQAKLKFDAPLTARRALRAPRKDVALALSWDHKVVQKLTDRIAVAAYRAPRNATVRITLRHMIKRASHSGRHRAAFTALRPLIEGALARGYTIKATWAALRARVRAEQAVSLAPVTTASRKFMLCSVRCI